MLISVTCTTKNRHPLKLGHFIPWDYTAAALRAQDSASPAAPSSAATYPRILAYHRENHKFGYKPFIIIKK